MSTTVFPLAPPPEWHTTPRQDDPCDSARPTPSRHMTILWTVLFNLAAIALTGVAFAHGWAQQIFAQDLTGLTYVIAGVFLTGLGLSYAKAWSISREIECVRAASPCAGSLADGYMQSVRGRSAGSRAIAASTLKFRVASGISPIQHVAGSLVLLGLIGTVLGFIIALSGVTAESASNLSETSAMVSRLIAGMSVALYTTLEGAILNIWLTVNYRIISTGAAELVSALVRLGECHERPRPQR